MGKGNGEKRKNEKWGKWGKEKGKNGKIKKRENPFLAKPTKTKLDLRGNTRQDLRPVCLCDHTKIR